MWTIALPIGRGLSSSAMPKKDTSADAPSFAEVVRELTHALGKPKKERGILRFKAPADAKAAKP